MCCIFKIVFSTGGLVLSSKGFRHWLRGAVIDYFFADCFKVLNGFRAVESGVVHVLGLVGFEKSWVDFRAVECHGCLSACFGGACLMGPGVLNL